MIFTYFGYIFLVLALNFKNKLIKSTKSSKHLVKTSIPWPRRLSKLQHSSTHLLSGTIPLSARTIIHVPLYEINACSLFGVLSCVCVSLCPWVCVCVCVDSTGTDEIFRPLPLFSHYFHHQPTIPTAIHPMLPFVDVQSRERAFQRDSPSISLSLTEILSEQKKNETLWERRRKHSSRRAFLHSGSGEIEFINILKKIMPI